MVKTLTRKYLPYYRVTKKKKKHCIVRPINVVEHIVHMI